MTIMTVNGSIKKEELGFCQCHEHLFIKEGRAKQINPALCLDDYQATVEELMRYKYSGGKAVVDAQPLGSGRNTRYLIEAARQTDLNIIASTGFHKLIYYEDSHWLNNIDSKDFKNILKEELTRGMYVDTETYFPQKQIDARAGIIKTAYSEENEDDIQEYERLLKAAARAAVETNRTVMCHTDQGVGALKVIDILTEEGLDTNSIIIAHVDRKADNYQYHYEIADKGVYLDYDSIGRFKYHTDEAEIKLIQRMIDNNYEEQLLLSLDTTRERMLSYGGNVGLDYINRKFIPLLKQHGIKDDIIEKITVTNPAHALSF